VKVDDWFKGLMATAVGEDEILVEVRVPVLPASTGAAYMKFPHPASRFAVVGVAAAITLDSKGACAKASVGVTGAGTKAVRAKGVEAGLQRQEAGWRRRSKPGRPKGGRGVDVQADLQGSVEYKSHLCASSPSALLSLRPSSGLAGSRRRAGERGRSTTRHAPALPIAAGLHHPRMRPLSLSGNCLVDPLPNPPPTTRQRSSQRVSDSFFRGTLDVFFPGTVTEKCLRSSCMGCRPRHRVWRALAARLRRADVVTLSLPGFGCEIPTAFDCSKEAYCDWSSASSTTSTGP